MNPRIVILGAGFAGLELRHNRCPKRWATVLP
jgi:NADH dehydrogenase FAD-containing subunit